MNETKSRLRDKQVRVIGEIPDKYILKIETQKQAVIVEGRKDFSAFNNREATQTAWFEFMKGIAQSVGAAKLNDLFGLSFYPPNLKVPQSKVGFVIEHLQKGTLVFRGRKILSVDPLVMEDAEQTTVELLEYLLQLAKIRNEALEAHLSDYGFGVYDK